MSYVANYLYAHFRRMNYELATHLSSLLEKMETLHNLVLQDYSYLDDFLMAIDAVDQESIFLHHLSRSIDGSSDVASEIVDGFREVHKLATELYYELIMQSDSKKTVGRPKFYIPKDTLEELRGLGLTWVHMSRMFKVSRWTIQRIAEKFGIQNTPRFSSISDDEMDTIVRKYITTHGSCTGEPFMSGHFRSQGHPV